MTANYLVCNIEGTNKRAEYKINLVYFYSTKNHILTHYIERK